jgi:hypothetical protein
MPIKRTPCVLRLMTEILLTGMRMIFRDRSPA